MILLKALSVIFLVTVIMMITKFVIEEFRKIDIEELKKGWNNED